MRRPPLITFLTFNKLGRSILSLNSLLESTDDFDLYLLDNCSQDYSWEYVNSINDPRIKGRFRSETNSSMGIVNKTLLSRKNDQDWLNYENDCLVHTKNFISIFHEIFNCREDIYALSGTPQEYNYLFEDESKKHLVSGYLLYYPIVLTGMCLSIRYEAMNKMGFLDEISFGMDMELNGRIKDGFKKIEGYVLDIKCNTIEVPPNIFPSCDECKKRQSLCDGSDDCKKYYYRCHTDLLKPEYAKIREQRIVSLVYSNNLYCDTIYNDKNSFTEEKKKIIHENYSMFHNIYLKHLKSIGVNNVK